MNPKVLVIESNIVSRFEIRKLLNQLCCEMVTVVNGALAVEAVEREDFDIIIMNPNIALLSGVATTKKLRALRSKSELPILAMVNGYDIRLGYDYALAGVNDLVYMPASRESLGAALCKWLPVYRSSMTEAYYKTGTH